MNASTTRLSRCGEIILNAVKNNLRPRDIVTRKSIENAIASVAASGGSTNAVLHLLAFAREAEIPLTIDDFQEGSSHTPLLADLLRPANTPLPTWIKQMAFR